MARPSLEPAIATPKPSLGEPGLQLDASWTPVEAARRLAPLGACLLESRTSHPGARWSFVPFAPVRHLRWIDGVLHEGPRQERATLTDVLERLEGVRGTFDGGPPFAGGWVGYLSHEAQADLLDAPVATPMEPARPRLPTAEFTEYAGVLAIEDAARRAQLVVHHEDASRAHALRHEAQQLLARPAPPTEPASALPQRSATMTDEEFKERVRRLQDFVRNGDCFQVNLTASFAYPWKTKPSRGELLELYDRYAAANPGPWNAFYATDDLALLSASPELLVSLHEDRITLRPIAGTRPRHAEAAQDEAAARELLSDPKERAEHAMLVDLARNDAARVAVAGTVSVPEFASVERYRHVMHLVSRVEARATPDLSLPRLMEAVFPGGTVTGAPKRRAVVRISQEEMGPRGPYTGAFGYVSRNGSTEWNLLIRTLVATPTHLVAHAGCGIVEGSRPAAELAELEAKARAQIDAAMGRSTPAPPEARCGHATPGSAWSWPEQGPRRRDADVLLVDFEDSFVHNLADAFRAAGAATRVVSAHEPAAEAWTATPTHLVLSPGPGRPHDFPNWRNHLERAKAAGVPVLGVCLGHQAMAEDAGARIQRHPETVHGRTSLIRRTRQADSDPVVGAWRGRAAARYHSLVAVDAPARLVPLATLDDGTLMACRHDGLPWWGLQFHPESLLTEDGSSLLHAFLEVGRRDAR